MFFTSFCVVFYFMLLFASLTSNTRANKSHVSADWGMRSSECGVRNYIVGDFYVTSNGYKGSSSEGFENIFLKSYSNADLGQGVLE